MGFLERFGVGCFWKHWVFRDVANLPVRLVGVGDFEV